MTRLLILLGTLLLTLSTLGCSVLRELNVEQCRQDSDCARFGDYECTAERVCVAREVSSGGTPSTGGKGGSTTGAVSGGGTGGGVVAECERNLDCIEDHEGEPYICQRGSCVSLALETHCPYVVAGTEEDPTEYLTQTGEPIIFGAYVPIDVASGANHPYSLIFRFALEEFMAGTLGGVGQPARPFVMVLCDSSEPDDLEASAGHLVNTLDLPAILAPLPSKDLKATFDIATASMRQVFFLGALEADSALTSLEDEGRMWHILGPATNLVPAYVPLMQSVEAYTREWLRSGTTAKLKVAVVNTDETYSTDLAAALEASDVTINGHTLLHRDNRPYYQRFTVKAGTTNVQEVTQALKDPGTADIIISLGGPEFVTSIVPVIQAIRPSEDYPFYVLSPRNAFDKQLTTGSYYMPAGMTNANKFMAGVNFASVEDSKLYDEYLFRIQQRFKGQAGLESRENMYDAAYFMLYSLAAASLIAKDFDGDDVATGMKALIGGAVDAEVGPDDINAVLRALKDGEKVTLTGTLGLPDFNPLTGARKSPGSVWCVTKVPELAVRFDVLRLLSGAPPALQLGEEDFCYDNFFDRP